MFLTFLFVKQKDFFPPEKETASRIFTLKRKKIFLVLAAL
jgi:hypothetical protein